MAGPGCKGIRCGGCCQPLRSCACGVAPIKPRCLVNQHAFVFVEDQQHGGRDWGLFRCERCDVEELVLRGEGEE